MSITKELYKLQETDLELAAEEQTQARLVEQLKGNPDIVSVKTNLQAAGKQLAVLQKGLKNLEHEADEITAKMKKYEDELYSGRSNNTKELAGIQHEIELLKASRAALEDRELELMESVEKADSIIAKFTARLKKLEADWQTEEKRLTAELATVESKIAVLREKRDKEASTFDAGTMSVYEELKKKRGTSVAKVIRGTCQGCRIQLPIGELQQVRSAEMVRCSSCGRILLPDQ